jgi:hypothetical protein
VLVGPGHPEFWNPERFLPQLKVRAKDGSIVPFELWSHQRILAAAVRRCYAENRWLVHVKPRQEGSSTFFCGVGYQHAAYRPGCLVALLAHKQKTSTNLARIANRFHAHTPDAIRVPRKSGVKTYLEFPSIDSRFTIETVRGEEPLRGDTVQVLLASEVALWSETAGPDAWTAALNAVPLDSGFVIAESTPHHFGDQLQKLVMESEQPGSKWLKVFIPWTMVEEYRIAPPPNWVPPKDVLDYANDHGLPPERAYWVQREGLPKCAGDWAKFMAEYPINEIDCWSLAGEAVFPLEPLRRRLREIDKGTGLGIENEDYVEFCTPNVDHTYVVTLDPAGSWSKRDHHGMQVLDLEECEQAAEYQGHMPAHKLAKLAVETATKYNNAWIYVEANGLGEAVLSHILVLGYRNVYFRQNTYGANTGSRMPGWYATAKSKAEAVTWLQELIADGSLRLHSVRCIRQLVNYRGQWDQLSKARDERGGHFDLVAALAIAAWAWKHQRGRLGFRKNVSDPAANMMAMMRRLLDSSDSTGIETPWGKHR